MDISNLNKAVVLAALYNGSRQQGMGFMDSRGQDQMTTEKAAELLKEQTYFDYLHGRVMKIDLSGDDFRTHAYNRDNGPEAAERIIQGLQAAEPQSDIAAAFGGIVQTPQA